MDTWFLVSEESLILGDDVPGISQIALTVLLNRIWVQMFRRSPILHYLCWTVILQKLIGLAPVPNPSFSRALGVILLDCLVTFFSLFGELLELLEVLTNFITEASDQGWVVEGADRVMMMLPIVHISSFLQSFYNCRPMFSFIFMGWFIQLGSFIMLLISILSIPM